MILRRGCPLQAAGCGDGMSGADLYAVVSRAAMLAIEAQIELIDSGQVIESEAVLRVGMRHLLDAAEQVSTRLMPRLMCCGAPLQTAASVSQQEMAHYSRLQHAV